MNATVKNNGTKKVVTNVVTETAILNAVTKKVNDYKTNVLDVNANFKIALRSTGQGLKILIASDVLTAKQSAFIKAIVKDDNKYNNFDKTIRRTKDNKVTPFYILQALYRALK